MTHYSQTDLKIWLINLDHANTRRSQMSDRLNALGLDYERFSAVDGNLRSNEFMSTVDVTYYERFMGQRLLPGKVGCYFSHLAVWELLSKSTAKIGLILEDDAVFYEDFLDALELAMAGADHWDLLRLNSTRASMPIPQGRLGPYHLNAYLGRFTGNGCYLLHRDVAQRLVPALGTMKLAFEHEIGRYFAHNYRLFGMEPFPSYVDDGGVSQIIGTNGENMQKLPTLRKIPHLLFKASNYIKRFKFLTCQNLLSRRFTTLVETNTVSLEPCSTKNTGH